MAFFTAIGQSPERQKKQSSMVSEVISELKKATGWTLQNNGEWTSSQNKIPFFDFKQNKLRRGKFSLGRDNFNKIEIRQIVVEKIIYSILITHFDVGEYEFPILEQNWKEYNALTYYVFKEDRWNLVFPDSITFNKPYAINMRLLISGDIKEYNDKTYLFEIEAAIHKAIYLQEKSIINLIIAAFPVDIHGEKFFRFKFYETINKTEIYIKFLLKHNWVKLFQNYYWEVPFQDFTRFINNIGVIDPAQINNKHYYKYFLQRGIKMYGEGDYVIALQSFTKAAMVNPPDSTLLSIFYWKGKTKLALKVFEEAIVDFDSAINRIPKGPNEYTNWKNAHFEIGNAYYNMGNYVKACANWQKAAEFGISKVEKVIKKNCNKGGSGFPYTVNVDKAEKFFRKAVVKYERQKYVKALSLFEKSWHYNPTTSDYRLPFYIGKCKFNLGNYVTSVENFDQAYQMKPEGSTTESSGWSDILIWRGKAWQLTGYLKNACNDWNEAKSYGNSGTTELLEAFCADLPPSISTEKKKEQDYFDLGMVKYDAGAYDSAVYYFNRAIETNTAPQLPYYTYRASAKHKLSNFSEAVDDFTIAIKMAPVADEYRQDWIRAYYNRGISRYFNGDIEDACNDWKQAYLLGLSESKMVLRSYCDIDVEMLDIDAAENGIFDPDTIIVDESQQVISPIADQSGGEIQQDLQPDTGFYQQYDQTPPPIVNTTLVNPNIPIRFAIDSGSFFHIIIGSFSDPANAVKMADQLSGNGFNPKIIENEQVGYFRVSALSFDKRSGCVNNLSLILEDFPEAWILKY